MKKNFWKKKKLDELTKDEWEALCDGCGKCCLIKLEDEDTGKIEFTNVACKLLSLKNNKCLKYEQRHKIVHDCVKLSYQNIDKIKWMPKTCAYKLVSKGENLPEWHHLVSGNIKSVHHSGKSVRGKVIRENDSIELEKYIVNWI
ncbi:MAG: hypothetical protein CMM49_09575 [Rhodospirillaceae bacterium]|nr:hypothetical protein [Rhodospirillaceae bacterium]|tara:strand:- start:61 stop:492 length:432 start_codon:yes stop_codon:yes gene_type:complete